MCWDGAKQGSDPFHPPLCFHRARLLTGKPTELLFSQGVQRCASAVIRHCPSVPVSSVHYDQEEGPQNAAALDVEQPRPSAEPGTNLAPLRNNPVCDFSVVVMNVFFSEKSI